MTKSWRPEGWETSNLQALIDMRPGFETGAVQWRKITEQELKAYELGADAMLEALRELPSPVLPFIVATTARGFLRFIPDDEEE